MAAREDVEAKREEADTTEEARSSMARPASLVAKASLALVTSKHEVCLFFITLLLEWNDRMYTSRKGEPRIGGSFRLSRVQCLCSGAQPGGACTAPLTVHPAPHIPNIKHQAMTPNTTPNTQPLTPRYYRSNSTRRKRGTPNLKPHSGDNPGADRWFLFSIPVQMLPSGGSICGRLT